MYLLFVLVVYFLLAYFFVDWKNWRDYYPTILYFIVFNLLYNFIFYNYTLWKYRAVTVDWLNHTIIDISFTFIIVPIVLMIYLRYYPEGKKQFLYLAVWIAYFTIIEYIFYKKGLFIYENGWDSFWSMIFNIILFVVVRIHFKNPLLAIMVSIPIITILLMLFHPSISDLK
ncbi:MULTISPECIES: CBO0543 family protein [Sutcliffiella]|uniref:Uncharacterized protein n=1 Tax=Sutcliffiella cohnii TaxID=33932 RepID=A0A223KSD6_9BACI|nr:MULTISPECIES: CBO0543 family protein [Sutcliffiella]AST92405.1 hypothetical protein BC6307_14440 [Sutcliffiella cohnii]WBL13637.1 hypothetical protein O1A01_17165 [Sutcliffiella sp. NC1]